MEKSGALQGPKPNSRQLVKFETFSRLYEPWDYQPQDPTFDRFSWPCSNVQIILLFFSNIIYTSTQNSIATHKVMH